MTGVATGARGCGSAALDTSGTFWGAACFFAGAALLLRSNASAPEPAYASSAASMS